jgi:hypothetical protein
MSQPLDLDAIQRRVSSAAPAPWDAESTANALGDLAALLARVRELEAERALYVGVEPTIAQEMAELSRRLDAADAVVEQWADHCLGPQTRQLLDEIRAVLNAHAAPKRPHAARLTVAQPRTGPRGRPAPERAS